jgi:hypothetical protein
MTNVASVGGASTGRIAVGEPFSVGRALSRAFSVFSHGFIPFIVLTAIAYVPLLIVDVIANAYPDATVVGRLIVPFVQIVVGSISTATCLFGAYQIMRGRPFTIGESLMVALRRFWPVVGTSILSGLYVGVGMLLLIVPGIIISCAIYVALPVCVIERVAPVTSLKRSRALTKGHRWQIFGLFLIVLVAFVLIGFLIGFLVGLGAAFLAGTTAGVKLVAMLIAEILVGAFGSVLYAVVYHDLRVDKEGFDIEELASVFD